MGKVNSSIDQTAGAFAEVSENGNPNAAHYAAILLSDPSKFDFFYNNVADCFFMLRVEPDDCYRFVSVNETFHKITGLTESQVTGKRIEEVLPDSAHRLALDKYKSAIESNKMVQWEEIANYPTGTRISEISVIPVRNKNQGDLHLLGIIHDITERKQIERQLIQSGEDFRALVKATSQALWEADETGQSEGIEKWWGKLTGQTDYKNGKWIEALHPEDRENTVSAWQYSLEHKTFFSVDYRVKNRHGVYQHIAVRAVPVFNQDGTFRRWFGTLIDISENTNMRRALRESEERYRLLFEKNPLPMWVYDIETLQFLAVNEAAIIHYGYSREEFLSMSVKDIRPPEEIPALMKSIAERKSGIDNAGIWKHLKKDGSIIEMEIVRHELMFDGRHTILVLGYDVTERQQAAEALHKSEEKLRQSQKLESVGRLAGGIAHDFNNMLTAINGYSDLILRKLENDNPIRGQIEEISSAGQRAALLTHQLLAFSRQQILQPKIIDLNETVIQMCRMLRLLIGEHIHLSTNLHAKLGQVKADVGQISQVIMNLAVNARDAMPQGGDLLIETSNDSLEEDFSSSKIEEIKKGDYVALTITDTGTGIDENIKENIFEPFFTTKALGKGTGLGLATVYGIVKQSDGYIFVDSTTGSGTSFKIYLPRVDSEISHSENLSELPDLISGTETILLVEDEELVRNLTREILETCGYTVLEAENGAKALKLYENSGCQFDLLMTDVVMPQMGGRELAENLSQKIPGLKILFASGYTDDEVMRHGVIETSTNFIQKPYSPEALMEKIREILDKNF